MRSCVVILLIVFLCFPGICFAKKKSKKIDDFLSIDPDKYIDATFLPIDDEPFEVASGKTFKDPYLGMEFVWVKGGCYEMGDTFGDGYSDEKPVHTVCVDGLVLYGEV